MIHWGRRRFGMLKLMLGVVMLSCFLAAHMVRAEPQVIAFGATTVTLEHFYDPKTGNYYEPITTDFPGRPRPAMATNSKITPLCAVVDSGVMSSHPIIKQSLKESIDFTGEGPEDLAGHGTMIALLYLQNLPAGFPIVSVKVLDRRGKGRLKDLIKGIKWAANKGARIINVSAGVYLTCTTVREEGAGDAESTDSCERTPICQAVTALKDAALVIAAVGNDPGRIACPACCRDSLAVGAMAGDKIAPYTGMYPDVLAPGTVYFRVVKRSD